MCNKEQRKEESDFVCRSFSLSPVETLLYQNMITKLRVM